MPDEQRTQKPQLSSGDQARRALANAKRAVKDTNGSSNPQADFLLRQANVLALLDLADAIRSSQR